MPVAPHIDVEVKSQEGDTWWGIRKPKAAKRPPPYPVKERTVASCPAQPELGFCFDRQDDIGCGDPASTKRWNPKPNPQKDIDWRSINREIRCWVRKAPGSQGRFVCECCQGQSTQDLLN